MKRIEDLYLLYKTDIYRYLLSLTHDPNLSEDLLSETFLSAIVGIEKFRGDSSIKTWLFSIARNVWLQRIRKEKKTIEYNDLLELYVSNTMDEKLITEEMIFKINNLLEKKDSKTIKIIKMRVEGFSYKEVSNELKISESSARVIDFRTKKWIKETLEKEELY